MKRKQSQIKVLPELSYGPEPEANARGISSLPSRKGFHVLPFIALQGSSGVVWDSSVLGEIAVEQKLVFHLAGEWATNGGIFFGG